MRCLGEQSHPRNSNKAASRLGHHGPRGIGNGSDDGGFLAERGERETKEEQAKDR